MAATMSAVRYGQSDATSSAHCSSDFSPSPPSAAAASESSGLRRLARKRCELPEESGPSRPEAEKGWGSARAAIELRQSHRGEGAPLFTHRSCLPDVLWGAGKSQRGEDPRGADRGAPRTARAVEKVHPPPRRDHCRNRLWRGTEGDDVVGEAARGRRQAIPAA